MAGRVSYKSHIMKMNTNSCAQVRTSSRVSDWSLLQERLKAFQRKNARNARWNVVGVRTRPVRRTVSDQYPAARMPTYFAIVPRLPSETPSHGIMKAKIKESAKAWARMSVRRRSNGMPAGCVASITWLDNGQPLPIQVQERLVDEELLHP